ncbi:C4-dicarboxylate TRAP transporter substrate-binding protein (plasmid) [Tistrella bauzanensis]|nr:C4-dicarboxylate TRAP transporter substrate-binding protein [Tistrella bauzanensis]
MRTAIHFGMPIRVRGGTATTARTWEEKMKRFMTGIVAALTVGLGATSGWAEEYPAMTLNMAHYLPETYAGVEWERWWADQVAERSDGAITIEIFWGGTLGGATEILELVGSGAVPLGVTAQGYFMSDLPVAGTAGNLMMRTHADPAAALDTWRQFQKDAQVQKELKDAGLVELTAQASNPYKLTCVKPVRSLEAIKGLRIRVPGAYMPEWWASLGAVPVNVPLAEQYEAIQKGTVDCAYSPHDQIFSTKLDEVAKYAIDLSTGSHVTWNIFMNRDAYEALPETVKTLFQTVSDDMMARMVVAYDTLARETVEVTMPAKGVELVHFDDVDKVDAAALDTIDLWVQRLGEQGLADAAERLAPILREKRASFDD